MFRFPSILSIAFLAAFLPGSARADILGSAESFAILASSTVTNTGPSILSGNLGVWPGTAISGFPPGVVVNGTIHSADAVAMQAQNDANTGYNTLAGLAPNQNLTGQDLGGLTLPAGVYFFASSAQLTGTLTLDTQGDPNALFVFQIGSTLTTASNSNVITINGPDECHVYWQIGSSATLGTGTTFLGNIVAQASVTMTTGSMITSGRAIALNGAVTLDDVDVTARCTCILGPMDMDCNANGVPDACDIADDTSRDCNANGIPDECDIATGTSRDCNLNGIPDECDPAGAFPSFTTCEPTPTGSVGSTLTFQICAVSGSSGSPITMTLFNTLPIGATLTPPLPATGTSICTTFQWTPTAGQMGAPILEFFVTDANGCTADCKMRILVNSTLLLFGPAQGVSQIPMFGQVFDTQLTSVRRAFPVSTTNGPAPLFSATTATYFVQVVSHGPPQFSQSSYRWSHAVRFTKDMVGLTILTQDFGTANGIDLDVEAFTDANGLRRVRFPFSFP